MSEGLFAARLASVRERMGEAARRSGRSADDIALVAVTKTVPMETIEAAVRAGLTDFGESRVQETAGKRGAPGVPVFKNARWHMIGHLQTNKVKKAAELFDVIQSLGSLRLADALNREAGAVGKRFPCLVEVKLSGEPAKQGVSPEELPALLEKVRALPNLELRGLMTVPPYFEAAARARPFFARLRALSEKHRALFEGGKPVLSMGMSHDFEAAIEEGATMIRVGSALFGERAP